MRLCRCLGVSVQVWMCLSRCGRVCTSVWGAFLCVQVCVGVSAQVCRCICAGVDVI